MYSSIQTQNQQQTMNHSMNIYIYILSLVITYIHNSDSNIKGVHFNIVHEAICAVIVFPPGGQSRRMRCVDAFARRGPSIYVQAAASTNGGLNVGASGIQMLFSGISLEYQPKERIDDKPMVSF